MEEISATNPKLPAIVEFNGTHSCAHARKTIPLAPIHLFTKQIVPSLYQESFTQSSLRSFSWVLCVHLIKGFLLSITFLRTCHFFFVCFFHFHRTLFVGLQELV